MPATDPYTEIPFIATAPAVNAEEVTPHNTTELTSVSRALWVGTGGNVKVTMKGGAEVTFTGVPDGTLLPFRVKIVWSTGTTASGIVAVY